MKQKKSHTRIQQVILERRQNSKRKDSFDMQTACSKQMHKAPILLTPSMLNCESLSQSSSSSALLPKSDVIGSQSKNMNKLSNLIAFSSVNSEKQENHNLRREIRTARPVSSRRKIASKQKYSQITIQKEDPFKLDVKKSQVFEPLHILEPQFFIIQKGEHSKNHQQNEVQNLKAFWAKSHTFVSLFPLQYTECVVYKHPNILPVYGEVKLKEKRYVVSNEYKHSSLKDLIKQFGAFEQTLCKIYLFEILSGLQEMHDRRMAHNRLSTESILYDKEGQIFINVVKSTSRPLTEKQKQEKMFQYSPEILLTKSKSNSRRSDIWSIGILLLDMLFNFQVADPKYMQFHPYNSCESKLSKDDGTLVDNLKQLYPKSFATQKKLTVEKQIMSKFESLSEQCKDVIFKCLRMNRDERINLKALKEHPFFFK